MLIKHESFDVTTREKSHERSDKFYESRKCPYLKFILIPLITVFMLTCILLNVNFGAEPMEAVQIERVINETLSNDYEEVATNDGFSRASRTKGTVEVEEVQQKDYLQSKSLENHNVDEINSNPKYRLGATSVDKDNTYISRRINVGNNDPHSEEALPTAIKGTFRKKHRAKDLNQSQLIEETEIEENSQAISDEMLLSDNGTPSIVASEEEIVPLPTKFTQATATKRIPVKRMTREKAQHVQIPDQIEENVIYDSKAGDNVVVTKPATETNEYDGNQAANVIGNTLMLAPNKIARQLNNPLKGNTDAGKLRQGNTNINSDLMVRNTGIMAPNVKLLATRDAVNGNVELETNNFSLEENWQARSDNNTNINSGIVAPKEKQLATRVTVNGNIESETNNFSLEEKFQTGSVNNTIIKFGLMAPKEKLVATRVHVKEKMELDTQIRTPYQSQKQISKSETKDDPLEDNMQEDHFNNTIIKSGLMAPNLKLLATQDAVNGYIELDTQMRAPALQIWGSETTNSPPEENEQTAIDNNTNRKTGLMAPNVNLLTIRDIVNENVALETTNPLEENLIAATDNVKLLATPDAVNLNMALDNQMATLSFQISRSITTNSPLDDNLQAAIDNNTNRNTDLMALNIKKLANRNTFNEKMELETTNFLLNDNLQAPITKNSDKTIANVKLLATRVTINGNMELATQMQAHALEISRFLTTNSPLEENLQAANANNTNSSPDVMAPNENLLATRATRKENIKLDTQMRTPSLQISRSETTNYPLDNNLQMPIANNTKINTRLMAPNVKLLTTKDMVYENTSNQTAEFKLEILKEVEKFVPNIDTIHNLGASKNSLVGNTIHHITKRLASTTTCNPIEDLTNCALTCSDGNVNYVDQDLEYVQKGCSKSLILTLRNCIFPDGILKTSFFAGDYTLKEIHIINCNLETIQSGAFKKTTVQNLLDLELINNTITTMTTDTFEGLKALEYFLFSQQPLVGKSFTGSQFLNVVAKTLQFATIMQMTESGTALNPREWWQGTDLVKLTFMDLSNNNLRGQLNAETFRNAVALRELHLENCYLDSIDNAPFGLMENLQILNLDNNRLITLDIVFLDNIQHKSIQLSSAGNAWNCDCSNRVMIEYLQNDLNSPTINAEDYVCSAPEEWDQINMMDVILSCESTTEIIDESSSTVSSTATATSTVSSTVTSTISSTLSVSTEEKKSTTTITTSTEEENITTSPDPDIEDVEQDDTMVATSTITSNEGEIFIECSIYSGSTLESCSSVSMKDKLVPLTISSTTATSVTIKSNYFQKELTLIYFNKNKAYQNTSQTSLMKWKIDNLEIAESYLFCVLQGSEITISPFDCLAHSMYSVAEVWLSFEDMGWFITVIAFVSFNFFIIGGILVYYILRRRPTWFFSPNTPPDIKRSAKKSPLLTRLPRPSRNLRVTYLSPASRPDVCLDTPSTVYDSKHRPPMEPAPMPPNEYHEIPASPHLSKHRPNHCSTSKPLQKCDNPALDDPGRELSSNVHSFYAVVCESPCGSKESRQSNVRNTADYYALDEDLYHVIDHYEAVAH